MSNPADLLRRAAVKLRETLDATEAFSPWTADAGFGDGRAWINVPGATHAWGMHGFPGEAQYVALMHPPVALALADLLDSVVAEVEDAGVGTDAEDLSAFDGLHRNAVALARAVLREPEETRDA